MGDMEIAVVDGALDQKIREEISKTFQSKKRRIFSKFAMAALGSVPWVGGFLSAMMSYKDEEGTVRANELQTKWLEEHSTKMNILGQTLAGIFQQLENFGEQVDRRLESEEYLSLVRRAFRSWDQAETKEKKGFARKIITNAAAASICPDDLIRLFLDWVDRYHESHFAVMREVYQNPGSTRGEIWSRVHGAFPREDSAEADLFKMLIHDLSTGHVMRQERATDHTGRFLRKQSVKTKRPASPYMKSAFDDDTGYVLTELGRQFIHYTMEEVVPRIDDTEPRN